MAQKHTELICINCPRGCTLQVEQQGEERELLQQGDPLCEAGNHGSSESPDDTHAS